MGGAVVNGADKLTAAFTVDATTGAPDYAGHSGAHTPGEWRAICGKVTNKTGSHFIADCGSGDEPYANARLIAAAPELLEALRTLMAEYIADNPQSSGADNPDCSIAMIAAHAAIAKAEGRS